MVTLIKYGALSGGEKYNVNVLSIDGLSTDTKPTVTYIEYGSDGREVGRMGIPNGSIFTEIDTGDTYMYDVDATTWHKVSIGGGGGGGSVYESLEAGVNITIEETSDGKAKISASGEVSSEDAVARADIAAIKDGETLDSFGDVETALATKADTSTTYTKTEVDTALSAKANSADVYTKTAVDTALSAKANSADVYSKSDIDTAMSEKADKSTTYTKTEIDTALGDKVDKVAGKGLSTEDFTTAEKTKLDDLAEIKSIGTGLNLNSSTGELTATGGGGGTSDYTDLSNKPQINSITLTGNKTTSDLGIDEVPEVGANDDGKVLKASYSGGVGTYSWQTGGGSGGTSDYTDLTNKPQINSVTLSGNKSLSDIGALPSTTTYAGSSTVGGSATSAAKLDTTSAGSTTQPVYFSNGVPTATTYALNKTVPSDAVFTDTTYESKTAASGGTDVSLCTTGEKYTWNNKIGASDYATQGTGGTVRVWTTTDGTDTILHIANEAPAP